MTSRPRYYTEEYREEIKVTPPPPPSQKSLFYDWETLITIGLILMAAAVLIRRVVSNEKTRIGNVAENCFLLALTVAGMLGTVAWIFTFSRGINPFTWLLFPFFIITFIRTTFFEFVDDDILTPRQMREKIRTENQKPQRYFDSLLKELKGKEKDNGNKSNGKERNNPEHNSSRLEKNRNANSGGKF